MAATDKLHEIIHSANKMLLALIDLPVNKDVEAAKKRLQQLRRRAYIMALLNEKLLIAVTGLQGVGKSSLISQLYEFDKNSTPFLTNQGQGETLPILVSEDSQPGKYFVHKVVKENFSNRVVREELSNVEEFRNRCHNYNNDQDIFLEITVLRKIFSGPEYGFLLLPGFQSTTDYLKELTYSALRASMNCIVLFYQAKYAHRDNRELIETLNNEFKEASPIFVITWSDNENTNSLLETDVKNDLNIAEDDRVIRTGEPGPEKWREKLINSIKKYSAPIDAVLGVKEKNLRHLVSDFNEAVAEIKGILQDFEVDLDNKEYRQVDVILKEFRKESKNVENILTKTASDVYSPYFQRVVNCVSAKIEKQYGGVKGFFRKISETWTLDVTLNRQLRELIQDCLDHANESSIDQEYLMVLNKTSNIHWKNHNFIMNLPEGEYKNTPTKQLLSGRDSEKSSFFELSEPVANDISVLFGEAEGANEKLSDELVYSIRLLPAFILEMTRTAAVMKDIDINTPELILDPAARTNLVELYEINKKDILKGMAVFLGFDLVEGNGLDLFGFLAQHKEQLVANTATGAANSASTAAIAGLQVNWIAASIVGVASIFYFANQIIKSIDRRAENLDRQVSIIQEHVINNIQFKYRLLMENYEQLIRDRLMRKFQLHKSIAHISNCNLAVQKLENSIKELDKEIIRTMK
jgi:hypothetical protein